MRAPKIEVRSKPLGTLIADIQQGRIRVPRFQREFVWERSRILKLLDSMLEEYPIGTIFLWDAPPEYNYLLRNIDELSQPSIREGQGFQLILDGQLRLTSLYVVIQGLSFDGENYGKIVVDLEGGSTKGTTFKYRDPDKSRWVSVSDLLSGGFSVYEGLPSSEHKERFQDVSDALRNYPFSVVTVTEMELDDAIEIFERINQQGRKLSRYDLICAGVMTADFDLRELSQKDIVEKLEPGFGKIEETSIPQAVALNSKRQAGNKAQLDLTTADIQGVWDVTVSGFALAADFMKQNLGVVGTHFLPYDAMLPIVVHYFFDAGAQAVQSTADGRQLSNWFWRSAFSERYGESSQTRMTEDAKWIRDLIEKNESYPPLVLRDEEYLTSSSMTSRSALRNGILCLLSIRKPKHFVNGSEFDVGDDYFSDFSKPEKHHIFPVAFLKKRGYNAREVHRIPNFCFIPAELNQDIGSKPPSQYMQELRDQHENPNVFRQIMHTHLIPVDEESGIWTDNYELFLHQRALMLTNAMYELCGMTASILPEMQDPTINTLEIALRDSIHSSLNAVDSKYWKRSVPPDIRDFVDEMIDEHLEKMPGSRRQEFNNHRKKLDFCDFSHYLKIIDNNANWVHFKNEYRNREEIKRVLSDLGPFRNAVKHNRPVDAFLNHRAQAAILWLKDILNVDLSDYGV